MMKRYEKYKPSGVDWIGEIPEHWRVKKFKHLYKSSMGATILKTDLLSEGKIPVYSATETDILFGYVDETNVILELGDLVIPARGNSIGHVTIVNGIATCTQTTIYAKRLSDDFSDRFLYHYLKGLRELLFQFDRTAIPQITVGQIKENPVALPPPTEQTAIANYLDEKTTQIDTLITNKQKLIELLKEERTAVINQAVTKGINPNANLKSSGLSAVTNTAQAGIEWLGDIPEHWEVKKLKYVASLKSGEGITADSIRGEGEYPVFGGNGVRGYTSSYSHEGDFVLIGRQGALCGNINYAKGKFWASEHAVVATPIESYNLIWFGELLRIMNLNQHSQSAAQPGLAVETIKNLFVAVPPFDEQNKITHAIQTEANKIDTTISKIEKEIELLQEYRTALISEVVTGKIKVI